MADTTVRGPARLSLEIFVWSIAGLATEAGLSFYWPSYEAVK